MEKHYIVSLYETFPAEEAKRLRDKPEIYYTLKHGSRLNMAEIELTVINNRGLSGRIPGIEQMRKEAAAWNRRRNKKPVKSTGWLLPLTPALNSSGFTNSLNDVWILDRTLEYIFAVFSISRRFCTFFAL
jgi:hypothetical protein